MTSRIEEYFQELSKPLIILVWVALVAVFGVSGPFGSYAAFAFPKRLLIWAMLIGVGLILGTLVRIFVDRNFTIKSTIGHTVVIGALNAILWTPLFYLVLEPKFGPISPDFPTYFEVMLFTFATSCTVSMFRRSLRSVVFDALVPFEDTAVQPLSDDLPSGEVAIEVRLLQRLPEQMQGNLEAISVRDHYVDVRTTAGQASLLMRLSDAIAETEGVEGAQVHRSHWVAWAAVSHVEREGPKLVLVLHDGARVPVSRNHRNKVEARGML